MNQSLYIGLFIFFGLSAIGMPGRPARPTVMTGNIKITGNVAITFTPSGGLNPAVLGVTPTSALLTYTAPNSSACTVLVSETAGPGSPVADVDTTKFSGSNSDTRFAFLEPNATTRYFVVGTIPKPSGLISNLASDGNYYGRALQPNTTHYYKITCGATIATGQFTTPNLPIGKTYGEPQPIAGAGVYAFPSMFTAAQWQLSNPRTFQMRDPTTGIPVQFFDVPGEYRADYTNKGNGNAFNATSGAILGTWMTINAAGAGYRGGDTGVITGGGGSGATYRVHAAPGGAVTQLWLSGGGRGHSVTTGAATSATTGTGTGLTVNITSVSTCTNWTSPANLLGTRGFATYSGTTQDKCPAISPGLFESNGAGNYNTDALQVSFTAKGSANGDVLDACVTVNGSTCWGGTVQVALTTRPTTYCLPNPGGTCHSSSGSNRPSPWQDGWSRPPVLSTSNFYSSTMTPNALGTQNPAGSAPNGNFGWLFWKDSTSSSDTISIQKVLFSHYTSLGASWYDSGIEWACGEVQVQDSNSVNGYLCQLPVRNGGLELVWVRTDTGEARWLGKILLAAGQITNFTSQAGFSADTSTFDHSIGTAMYFIKADNQSPTRHAHVLKCSLPASGNSFYSQSQPPNTQACDGNTTSCGLGRCTGTWRDLTPGPNYLDKLINTFDSTYNYTTFRALGQNGTQSHYLLWSALSGSQNSPAWLGAFDLNTNSVIAAVPMYNRQASAGAQGLNMDFCGYHTSHSPGNTTWWHWGDHTAYPRGAGIPASMITTSLTAAIPAGNPGYKIAVSFAGEPTLQNIAVNDWIQIDNEGFQVTSVDGNNNYHLNRGQTLYGSFPRSSPSHANGATVQMFCDNGIYGTGTPGQNWWNLSTDPHGNSIQLIQDSIANHDSYAYNPATGKGSALAEPGSWSACYNYSPGTNCPTRTSGCAAGAASTCAYVVTNSPAFAGVTKGGTGNSYTKHPTAPQQINGSDLTWGLDVNPIQGNSSANPQKNASNNTLTAVEGNLYYFTPDPSYDLKNLATIATVGWRPLLDVSGPSSSIGGTSADNCKYCYVYVAGECYSGSAAGNVYVNAPYLVVGPYNTTGSHCFDGNGNMLPGFPAYTESELCFNNTGGLLNELVQIKLTPPDSTGANSRALSWEWTGFGMHSLFANAHPTPDGLWIIGFGVTAGAAQIFMHKQPPMPASDGVNRTDFEPQTVNVTGSSISGTTSVLIEFGYDSNFYCTSRQDKCVANQITFTDTGASCSTSSSQPFCFESDAKDGPIGLIPGVACSTTCAVQVPALPGHVLYYQIVHLNASHTVLGRETPVAIAVN